MGQPQLVELQTSVDKYLRSAISEGELLNHIGTLHSVFLGSVLTAMRLLKNGVPATPAIAKRKRKPKLTELERLAALPLALTSDP